MVLTPTTTWIYKDSLTSRDPPNTESWFGWHHNDHCWCRLPTITAANIHIHIHLVSMYYWSNTRALSKVGKRARRAEEVGGRGTKQVKYLTSVWCCEPGAVHCWLLRPGQACVFPFSKPTSPCQLAVQSFGSWAPHVFLVPLVLWYVHPPPSLSSPSLYGLPHPHRYCGIPRIDWPLLLLRFVGVVWFGLGFGFHVPQLLPIRFDVHHKTKLEKLVLH